MTINPADKIVMVRNLFLSINPPSDAEGALPPTDVAMFLASCGPPVNSHREAQQRPTFRSERTAIDDRQYTCSLNVSTDSEQFSAAAFHGVSQEIRPKTLVHSEFHHARDRRKKDVGSAPFGLLSELVHVRRRIVTRSRTYTGSRSPGGRSTLDSDRSPRPLPRSCRRGRSPSSR